MKNDIKQRTYFGWFESAANGFRWWFLEVATTDFNMMVISINGDSGFTEC